MKKFLLLLSLFVPAAAYSQTTHTAEDSLQAGTSKSKVSLGGYGEAHITYATEEQEAEANLNRAVLFVGYRFNNRISFHSELEIEDAKIGGGEPGGEVAMEQAYLKFDVGRTHYLAAGLIIPRIGIINENHLPTTFNGVNRPFVEHDVIPATWREIGVGWYGTLERLGGLQYSLAVLNGLNPREFNSFNGIRNARYEGREASFSNVAITGSLVYNIKGLRLQTSAYYSGTQPKRVSYVDTISGYNFSFKGGAFAQPVTLVEANAQYDWKALHLRALASRVTISNPGYLIYLYDVFAPRTIDGWYAEAGVDVLYGVYHNEKKLIAFGRYERIHLEYDYNMMSNFNGATYWTAGLTFQPTNGVAVKLDYVQQKILDDRGFVNLGIGYSF